jgi:hypothetical protein
MGQVGLCIIRQDNVGDLLSLRGGLEVRGVDLSILEEIEIIKRMFDLPLKEHIRYRIAAIAQPLDYLQAPCLNALQNFAYYKLRATEHRRLDVNGVRRAVLIFVCDHNAIGYYPGVEPDRAGSNIRRQYDVHLPLQQALGDGGLAPSDDQQ